jgi:transposase
LTDQERARLNAETGEDGQWLLNLLDSAFAPPTLRDLPEVATLRKVWEEQFVIIEQKTILRSPKDLGKSEGGPTQTPHDPDVRWSKKRDQSWYGYKLQVTETFDEDLPHLITDIDLTVSTQSDQTALVDIVARQKENGTLPSQRDVDKGYTGGPNLEAAIERGEDLIGPISAKQSPQHHLEGGIKTEDFTFNLAEGRATCPAGQQSAAMTQNELGDLRFKFATETCAECPLRARCCTGAGGRSVQYSRYHDILLATQQKMEQPEYKELYKKRGGIEASLSNLVHKYGIRHTRYVGIAKNRLRSLFVGVGANLRRTGQWLGRKQAQQGQKRVLVAGSC